MTVAILLVDDHTTNRNVLRRRLERRGYAVAEAFDGADAVGQYQASKPQLVIMDLSMPGMSGFDALDAIRKGDPDGHIPVIALTAHVTESMRQKCKIHEFDGFLTKPIDFEGLVSKIASMTAGRPDTVSPSH
jgi:CheY-like chemotaxis protein